MLRVPVPGVYVATKLVPEVSASKDSCAPSGTLAITASARCSCVESISTTDSAAASTIATSPAPSVKLAANPLPAAGPFRSTTGASFCAVTVMLSVCAAEISTPPFAVPPLSRSTMDIEALPLASAAGVKLSVPSAASAGAIWNSAGLLLPEISKVRVCAAGSPSSIAVAQIAA
ncbi:MAG: hypothetical protein BWZ07_02304 [Alphaproteobacteria bacterium ADurb.BinA280]|nr:MAG: hypothetical protein BWZ07_02304 [Alphaproteobacteria bacterium ADurb.BinA280]